MIYGLILLMASAIFYFAYQLADSFKKQDLPDIAKDLKEEERSLEEDHKQIEDMNSVRDYALFLISSNALVEYIETDRGVQTTYQLFYENEDCRYAYYYSVGPFEKHVEQSLSDGHERLI